MTKVELTGELPAVTFAGENVQVELPGRLPHERVTREPNPPVPAIERVIVAD